MFSSLGVYSVFIRNACLNMLAYRMRYYTGILTYLLFVSVHYFIWQAVYANQDAGVIIKGFTLSEMITYISVGWIARSLYFSSIDEEIDELVSSGQVSIFLLRPVNFHLMMISQAAGESIFRAIFFTLPITIVVIYTYSVMLPATIYHGLWFLFSSIFSFLILVELNFLIGMLAFVIKSIEGVMRAKYFLTQLFSGLLLPLTFFPPWFQSLVDYLPFKAITYLPLSIYLGKVPPDELMHTILIQFTWFVGLYLFGELAWYGAKRKLTLQGG